MIEGIKVKDLFFFFCNFVNINSSAMTIKYIYWKDGEYWLGYLEEYPDYLTQGSSLEELQLYLKDLYEDLNSGEIPNVRRKGELEVA